MLSSILYPEPCQRSKIEYFAKIAHDLQAALKFYSFSKLRKSFFPKFFKKYPL